MAFIRNAWYVVAHANELDEGLVTRTICNEPIVMYRTSAGAPVALHDRCPHRLVPLSMGKRIGDSLQCGYHGLAFDATGACVDAPNEGGLSAERLCVRSYPIVERDRFIWLWLGDRDVADPNQIPEYDFVANAEFATSAGLSHIKANYQMLVDNLLDLSHVHYLHPGVHEGSDFASFVNEVKVEGETVWSMLWRPKYYFNETFQRETGMPSDVEGQGHSRWDAPGNILVFTAYWEHGKTIADGIESPSAHIFTPETEKTTHYFWVTSRNYLIHDEEKTRARGEFARNTFETQDAPMCEAQQAAFGDVTDLSEMKVAILKADAAGVLARRIIKRRIDRERSATGSNIIAAE